MKKAGLSRSKRTTRKTPNSKATPELGAVFQTSTGDLGGFQESWEAAAEAGHRPLHDLSPEQRRWIQQSQSNLISLLAHELRTPLGGVQNGVVLLVSLLEERLPPGFLEKDSELAQAFTQLERNVRRMRETLAVLLDLAQFEAGKFKVDAEWMPLPRIEERLQALAAGTPVSSFAEKAKSEVRVDLPRFLQSVERYISLFENGVGASRSQLSWEKMKHEEGLCGLSLIHHTSGGGEALLRLQKFHDEWAVAHSAFEAGVFSSGSAFSGILLGEAEFLARPDGAPLGPEWAMIQAAMKAHGGRFVLSWDQSTEILRAEFVLPVR